MNLLCHRTFVTAILLGKHDAVRCQPPQLLPLERASIAVHLRRHVAAPGALERAEADGLRVLEAHLPGRCGVQMGSAIYVPPGLDDDEAEVVIDHERCHHAIAARGLLHATESDAWLATAEAAWPAGTHRPVGCAHWFLDAIALSRQRFITKVIRPP